jgi:hypothetical protein
MSAMLYNSASSTDAFTSLLRAVHSPYHRLARAILN